MSDPNDILKYGSPARSTTDEGITTSRVSVSLNLESPALANAVCSASRTDVDLISNLSSADPDLRDYIIKHLGEDVLNNVIPPDHEFRKELPRPRPAEAEPLAIPTTRLPSSELVRAAAAEGTDLTRIASSLDSLEGGRFSMIVAISQGLINYNLEFIHWMEPSRQILNVRFPIHGTSIDNADLLPPKIALRVADETSISRGRAIYYLNFGDNGTCTLKNGSSSDANVTYSTKGWVFAFEVDITLNDLDPQSDEYKNVKEKFGQPGDYRITRLLANLETADIMSPEISECDFGDHNGDMTGLTFLSWQHLMLNWLFDASTSGAGLLGYSLSISDPAVTSAPPSFPPTDQLFQTYPYMASGQAYPITGLGGVGDNNMLVYLNMTQNLPFPANPKLPYTGNWCTPSDRGTMAIGYEVFFESFLLPQLQLLNKASFLQPEEPEIRVKRPLTWQIGFREGRGNHSDNFYRWNRNNDGGWPKSSWRWNQSRTANNSVQRNGMGRLTVTETIDVNNAIRVEPGSHIVRVDHEMIIKQKTTLRFIGTRSGTATIRRKVTYHIYIESVHEGNLQLRFPGSEEVKTEVTRDKGFWFDRDYVNNQASLIASELENDRFFPSVRAYLQAALQSYGMFVFPGGGYLFFKNPIFNAENDLLVRLEFNGL